MRVNYILDEFSSLPAIGGDFPSMISAARSRNIRYLICVQSKAQLKKRYQEEAATILSNCTNWIVLFTRELELLREVSALCGEQKDRTPNISVYDLQRLSKDKDEAILLTGKAKPCLVNLLDIDRFGDHSRLTVDFDTPERLPRYHIDFSELPAGAKAMVEKERAQLEAVLNFSDSDEAAAQPEMETDSDHEETDQLIARINQKIAELEASEREEAEASKLDQVIDTIKKRRDGLYQPDTSDSTEE